MRTFTLVSLLLLGVEGSLASTPTQNPEEMLLNALKSVGNCSTSAEDSRRKSELGDDHGEIAKLEFKSDDDENMRSISLEDLFQPGRYHMEYVDSNASLVSGVTVLKFSPLPEEKQLKAKDGEDKSFVRAMNHLAGSIYIARDGSILRVEAGLPETLPYKRYGLTIFNLLEATVSVEQSRDDGDLLSYEAILHVRGATANKFYGALARISSKPDKFHWLFSIRFQCAEN